MVFGADRYTLTSSVTQIPAYTIDKIPPAAPDTTPQEFCLLTKPVISGKGAEPGDTVTASLGAAGSCSALVDANGDWTCGFTQDVDSGTYTLSLTAKDLAGNTSPVTTMEFHLLDPAGDEDNDGLTNIVEFQT